MRIKELHLTNGETENLGLKPFSSTKFNSVIALVGKNGSGKTRYLKAIENYLKTITVERDFDKLFEHFPQTFTDFHKEYLRYKRLYETFNKFKNAEIQYQTFGTTETQNALNQAATEYNKEAIGKSFNAATFNKRNIVINSEFDSRIKIIRPNDLRRLQASFDSQNGKKTSFQKIIDSTVEEINVNEFGMISESALTFLKKLPHKLAYDDLQSRGNQELFQSKTAYKRFQLLSNLIKEFLGKELLWHSKESDLKEEDDYLDIRTTGYWTINDREFDYNDFSDGEKVLFTYAILLFLLNTNSKTKFKDSIIIIDEPELNLHPKAQIKLIQSLQELIGETGQLIIATHSLSIVANLDYGSIFLVRDNELISPSSSVPFNAIDELMGFEEHYNKIVEFLVSTPSWAMTNFMGQCFEDATVFESAAKNDPQLEIFKNLILERQNLVLLDFGSGKGRLVERVKENNQTWSRIQQYDCFDIDNSQNENVIAKGATTVFNNLEEIPDNNYDLIIVVNVLHEIHIKFWQDSLIKIKKALKSDGFIAIIEDTELPIGELPNELGFILLDKPEMKILLGDNINFITPQSERYKDRIICGLISQQDLNTINKVKLKNTLEKLKENSLQKIIDYRNVKEKDLKTGRLYALKSNLYVNSQLALDYLSK